MQQCISVHFQKHLGKFTHVDTSLLELCQSLFENIEYTLVLPFEYVWRIKAMGFEQRIRQVLAGLVFDLYHRQSSKRLHPVVTHFIPADCFEAVRHRLGAFDEDRLPTSIGRFVDSMPKIREARGLKAASLNRP